MLDNMAEKYFNFKDQLRIGDLGESDFIKTYKRLKPEKSKNLQIDFLLNNGKTVELKTDSYDMNKTPNFFMEQFTVNGEKKNLGGPWRSKDHKIDCFVYYFLNNKVFYWFTPETLCEFLDEFIVVNKLKPISIPNKDRGGNFYEALGFKIPRESLKKVWKRKHEV